MDTRSVGPGPGNLSISSLYALLSAKVAHCGIHTQSLADRPWAGVDVSTAVANTALSRSTLSVEPVRLNFKQLAIFVVVEPRVLSENAPRMLAKIAA